MVYGKHYIIRTNTWRSIKMAICYEFIAGN